MSYLILQIALCLLLAAVLGFLLGWLLKIWPKRGQIDELKAKIDALETDCDHRYKKLARRIYTLENPSKDLPKYDDLTEIKGVHLVLEKFLNDNGIYNFRQVALLSDKDVSDLADKLKGFQSRIDRDDWRSQAKDLHFDEYGEKL
ncbi:MAG: hypothetical protein ABIG69_17880 [Bacteroidota bacterium]